MNSDKDNHAKALRYWQKCTNSYLAASDYYQLQEDALLEILSNIETCERALDIGCGDGRYTLALRKVANSVLGIDVAPALIEEAEKRLSDTSELNIKFQVKSIESIPNNRNFNLVTCMGVTSGLIDNQVFLKAITDIAAVLKPKGKLIIKDTTSLGDTELSSVGDYIAVYRNTNFYLKTLEDSGFKIEKEIELSRSQS